MLHGSSFFNGSDTTTSSYDSVGAEMYDLKKNYGFQNNAFNPNLKRNATISNLKKTTSIYNLDEDAPEYRLRELIRSIVKKQSPIKATPAEDRRIKLYDSIILALCFAGIVIMMIQLLVFWDYGTGMQKNGGVQTLKIANICVTGVLYFFMGVHTRFMFRLAKREWKGLPKVVKFSNTVTFYVRNSVKFIVCAVQPIPFVYIDEIGVFMFLRLWAIFPVLRDFHPVFTDRREIVKTHRFALTNTRTFGAAACFKAVFATNPLIAVSVTVISSFAIAAFVVYVCERDYHDPSTRINYIYMALITITTVGYGDYAPYSPAGRAACVLTGFIGIITMAFVINMISSYLQLTPLQREAVDWTIDKHNRIALETRAAEFIQFNWRFYIYMKKTKFNTVEAKMNAKANFRAKATKRLKKLRSLRRKLMITDVHAEDPVLDKVLKLEAHITTLEAQNRLLHAKLDGLCDMLVKSPIFAPQATACTTNLVPISPFGPPPPQAFPSETLIVE